MAHPLFGFVHDYNGKCDACGAEMHADTLVVSDMGVLDKNGNHLYFVLGTPADDPGVGMGDYFECTNCKGRAIFLRLYQPIDVTEEMTAQKKEVSP